MDAEGVEYLAGSVDFEQLNKRKMEQKKGKVTEAKFYKEVALDHGTFYSHIIKFDNGDEGGYLSKSKEQNKFVVGQEVDYEWHPPKGGKKLGKVKPVQQNKGGSPYKGGSKPVEDIGTVEKKSLIYARQKILENYANLGSFAASYAKDIVKDKGEVKKEDFKQVYADIKGVMEEDLEKAEQKINEYLNR